MSLYDEIINGNYKNGKTKVNYIKRNDDDDEYDYNNLYSEIKNGDYNLPEKEYQIPDMSDNELYNSIINGTYNPNKTKIHYIGENSQDELIKDVYQESSENQVVQNPEKENILDNTINNISNENIDNENKKSKELFNVIVNNNKPNSLKTEQEKQQDTINQNYRNQISEQTNTIKNPLAKLGKIIQNLFLGATSNLKQGVYYSTDTNALNSEQKAQQINNINKNPNISEIVKQEYINQETKNDFKRKNKNETIFFFKDDLEKRKNQKILVNKETEQKIDKELNDYKDSFGNLELNPARRNLSDSIQQDQIKIQNNINQISGNISKKIAELSPSIGNSLAGAGISFINPYLGTSYFIIGAMGSYEYQAKQIGMTDEQARDYGLIMGYMEGATEMVGIDKFLKMGKAASKGAIKEALKNLGLDIIDNAIQEAVIDPIDETAKYLTSRKTENDYSTIEGGKKILSHMFKDGFDGALTALITGGVGLGISSSINIYDKIKNGEIPSQNEIKETLKDIQNSKKINILDMFKKSFNYQEQKIMNNDGQTFTYLNQTKNGDIIGINQALGKKMNLENDNLTISPAVVLIDNHYNIIDSSSGLKLDTTLYNSIEEAEKSFNDKIKNIDKATENLINQKVTETQLSTLQHIEDINSNIYELEQVINNQMKQQDSKIVNNNIEYENSQDNRLYSPEEAKQILKNNNINYDLKNRYYLGQELDNIIKNNLSDINQNNQETNLNNNSTNVSSQNNQSVKNQNNASEFYNNDKHQYAVSNINEIETEINKKKSYNAEDLSNKWADIAEDTYELTNNDDNYVWLDENKSGNLEAVLYNKETDEEIKRVSIKATKNGNYTSTAINNAIKEVSTIADENRPMQGQIDIEGNQVQDVANNNQEVYNNDNDRKGDDLDGRGQNNNIRQKIKGNNKRENTRRKGKIEENNGSTQKELSEGLRNYEKERSKRLGKEVKATLVEYKNYSDNEKIISKGFKEATGIDVNIFKTNQSSSEWAFYSANGIFLKHNPLANKQSTNFKTYHELGHWFKDNMSKQWQNLYNIMENTITKKQIEDYIDVLNDKSQLDTKTEAEIKDFVINEIISDYTGNWANNIVNWFPFIENNLISEEYADFLAEITLKSKNYKYDVFGTIEQEEKMNEAITKIMNDVVYNRTAEDIINAQNDSSDIPLFEDRKDTNNIKYSKQLYNDNGQLKTFEEQLKIEERLNTPLIVMEDSFDITGNNNPIFVPKRVISKAKNIHGITEKELYNLPDKLKNYVLVTKSQNENQKNSIIVFLDKFDSEERPIIVTMNLDKDQQIYKINEITSIYGRDNIEDFLTNRVNDKVLKINDKKIKNWLNSVRVQFPEELNRSLHSSITQKDKKVKPDELKYSDRYDIDEEDNYGFYSQLEKVIEEKMPNTTNAQQLKGILDKAGIKQDEMKWIGLDDYLKAHSLEKLSKEKVMEYIKANQIHIETVQKGENNIEAATKPIKEDIKNKKTKIKMYLEKYGIDFEESEEDITPYKRNGLMSGTIGDYMPEELEKLVDLNDFPYTKGKDGKLHYEKSMEEKFGKGVYIYFTEDEFKENMQKLSDLYDELHEAQMNLRMIEDEYGDNADEIGVPKYKQYALNGGTNYQEKLYTLPIENNNRNEIIKLEGEIAELRAKSYLSDPVLATDEERLEKNRINAEINKKQEQIDKLQRMDNITYNSPHWNEKNVLAHTRTQDFEDIDGNRVLFIDEIQSDLHQEGRKKGYINNEKLESITNLKKQLSKGRDEELKIMDEQRQISIQLNQFEKDNEYVVDKIYEKIIDKTDEEIYQMLPAKLQQRVNNFNASSREIYLREEEIKEWRKDSKYDKLYSQYQELESKYKEIANKNLEIQNQISEINTNGISDIFPFKKNWHEFALRRIINDAVSQGYDEVAWTTGRQQRERYNLSEQIDGLGFSKKEDATVTIRAYKDDNMILERLNIPNNELQEYIGKDLTTQILNSKENYGFIEDLDSSVNKNSNSGMYLFYDQEIPSYLNKYLKKWNSKVENITLKDADGKEESIQPGFKITDEMRDSIKQNGQPLFSDRADIDDESKTPKREYTKEEKEYLEKQRKERLEVAKMIKERSFLNNVLQSNVDKEFKKVLRNNKENFSYEPLSNEETMKEANKVYDSFKDFTAAKDSFLQKDLTSATDTAIGELLIRKALGNGNYQEANNLTATLAEKLTTAGQTVQAAAMFKRMTPEGMLMFAQKRINKINEELAKKYIVDKILKKKEVKQLELTDEKIEFINEMMKQMQEWENKKQDVKDWASAEIIKRQQDIILAKIMAKIGEGMPVSTLDKVAAWRNIAMLLNPKTIKRNLIGNIMFTGLEDIVDTLGVPIDKAVSLMTGEESLSLPNLKTQYKGLKKGLDYAIYDTKEGITTSLGGNKFEITPDRVFKNEFLNQLHKASYFGVEGLDRPFMQSNYDSALEQIMKKEGLEYGKDFPTNEMEQEALETAMYRTFKNKNKISDFLIGTKRVLNQGRSLGLGDVIGLTYPNIPGNLTSKTFDYSVIGFYKAIKKYQAIKAKKIGGESVKVAQRDFVRTVSRSMIGNGILAISIGAALAGIITASGDDDNDKLKELTGQENYAINVSALLRWIKGESTNIQDGDFYITYSNYEPLSSMIASAAEIGTSIKKDGKIDLGKAAESWINSIMELSTLNNFSQLFRYNLGGTLMNNIYQFPSSFLPNMTKQIAQLFEVHSKSNYSDSRFVKNLLNPILQKIPGLSSTLESNYDTFGNEKESFNKSRGLARFYNVFLNTSFTSTVDMDDTKQELYDLYLSTGSTDHLPLYVKNYFMYKGQKITLTAKEKAKYQETLGKRTAEEFKKIMATSEYKNMTDEEKVKKLKNIISDINTDVKGEVVLEPRGLAYDSSFTPTGSSLSKSGYKLNLTEEMQKEYEQIAANYYSKYQKQGLYNEEKLKEIKSKAKDYAKSQMFIIYKDQLVKNK